MPVEPSSQSGSWNCVEDALAEIRAWPDRLQTFVSGVFDELDSMTEKLLAQESIRQDDRRRAEHEALEGQIDRLAAVVAQLAGAVAEQDQAAGRKNGDGRGDGQMPNNA